MIGMLLALFASFSLRLQVSLPRTNKWLFSLMSASCFGLRPPVAMTDGWFLYVHAVSSAGLCHVFLEFVQELELHEGPQEPLLVAVKRQKLSWFGHITCHNSLSKIILQGTLGGGRCCGQQRNAEWTTSKSGHPSPCQNSSQQPPTVKNLKRISAEY